jgi:hypothetical protein
MLACGRWRSRPPRRPRNANLLAPSGLSRVTRRKSPRQGVVRKNPKALTIFSRVIAAIDEAFLADPCSDRLSRSSSPNVCRPRVDARGPNKSQCEAPTG